MLFNDKERASLDSKSYIEDDWDYLDRSGRVEAKRVPDFFNKWVSEYPDSDRAELIARITSGDNRHFQSAIFELVLYALLRSLGCSITVHPELPNGSKTRPDFLIDTPQGESIYLEAVIASEYSEADVATRKRTSAVLNSIEKIECPNFFLGIKAEGNPERPPGSKFLRNELERWLGSLDPDAVAHDVSENGHEAIPRKIWKLEDWIIEFEAIPIKPDRRGKGQRVIGLISGGARFVNSWEPIRDAVKAKGNRYGVLPHPLLVAITVDALSLDRIDEMQGLFGQEGYIIDMNDTSAPPQMRRKANGAWFGERGPQYTRVGGAWIFDGMNPWNIISRKNTLYFNPWAAMSLPEFFTTVQHAKVEGEQMQWREGRSLRDILSLSIEWPA